MNALNEQFIAEARELIHQATEDLIAVEREGFALERIDRVFRAFHTLKGSAGVVNLPAMALTLHAAEDLLAAVHAGKLDATSAIIDQSLACLDQVALWVDDFEAGGALPPHAGEDARAMAERLYDLLPGPASEADMTSDRRGPVTAADGGMPEWVSRLIAAEHARISARYENPRPSFLHFPTSPNAVASSTGTIRSN